MELDFSKKLLGAFTMESSTVSCHPMVTRSKDRAHVPEENSVGTTIPLTNASKETETVARIWKYRRHLLTHVRLLALRQLSYEEESVAKEETKSEIEKWEPEADVRMEFESEEDKEACADSSALSNQCCEHIDGLLEENSEYTKLRPENLCKIADDVAAIESHNEFSHDIPTANPNSPFFTSRYCHDMLELREDLERIVFLRRAIEQLKAGMELTECPCHPLECIGAERRAQFEETLRRCCSF
ncbi:hypothetical protein ANCCAN_00684 [Ancylostoma caninum]|uniref:Uncharacterized protein n=1 Tax=Ancylostoma caninum TaxID=29170 RepID=A0A368H950_ANCCA|nr:hypothetical protein ANCCAN_00684 [Ancylostoma caninum]